MNAAAPLRSLTLLQAQRLAGTLTMLAAFSAAAISGELGGLYCALFLFAFGLATWERGRFPNRHAALWTVLLSGALVVFALQVVTGALDVVLGAARFVLFLCAHRLWNRKTERDELLLMLLSLLLLCAGAALSAALLFGFAFALYAVAGTWALALTHLRFRIEESRAESAPAMLHSRRLITPQMLLALGGLSLAALAGAAALFFFFPRVTLGGLHRLAHPQAVAGLTDSIELGGHGAIADDPRVALRARLGPDEPPGTELSLHWRARALEVWTGRGWRARPGAASSDLPRPSQLARSSKEVARKLRWHITELELLAAFSEGVLLAPEGLPVGVHFPQPLSARPGTEQALINTAGDLLYQPIETGDLRYLVTTVSESPGDDPARIAQRPPPDVLLDAEAPPDLNPRVRALGEKLTKGKTTRAGAQAIVDFLSSGFRYTRELEDGGSDPIADFLFRRRAGHCELFSSAMVLLLRAAGIPARNVTGYYGGVAMPGGYTAIRAGDAHSWVEVWEPGAGWVLWDPTPADERGSRQDGLVAGAVLLWDGLEARWLSTVIEFDLLAQARALSEAARIFEEAGRRLAGRGTSGSVKVPVARLAVLLVLTGLSIALWRRVRARRQLAAGQKPLAAGQLRARKLWRRAHALLMNAGAALSPNLPPREAARRALEHLPRRPRIEASLTLLVDRCARARWGGDGLEAAEARALLSGLRRALRESRAQAGPP